MTGVIKIDCKACDQKKSMFPTKVNKMSPIVVLIGWILIAPSILGMLFSLLIFFSTISAASQVSAQALSDAESTGAAIGTGIGIGFSVFIGISSLISGLIGYLLIMKKNVFKCNSCGSISDRA